MNYKKIVVAGGGILGSQIAFQTAYCGFDVTILIRKEDSKEELNKKLSKLHDTYVDTINEMSTNENAWARGIADKDNFDKSECVKKANEALSNIIIEMIIIMMIEEIGEEDEEEEVVELVEEVMLITGEGDHNFIYVGIYYLIIN